MRAAQQGIGAVFTTCWRPLVLKNVAQERLPEWRMLLGRHGVRVRHVDAALHWQVSDRLPEARELAGTMIARLSRRSIVTWGLSFAVTDDSTRHEVAVAIQPLADERLPLSGRRRRYAVRHREGFDRHNPGWLTFARRLRERDLAAALAALTRRFYRDDGEPPPPRRCRRSRRSRSAPELGRAPPAATSTTPRTATRSARWHPAPHSRRCPPAGAARYATARLPTTNRCRALWHRPRTRPPNAEPHGLLAAASTTPSRTSSPVPNHRPDAEPSTRSTRCLVDSRTLPAYSDPIGVASGRTAAGLYGYNR